MILELVKNNKNITTDDIAEDLKVARRKILREIDELKEQNKIKRIGGRKTGYWEVIE